MGGPEALDPIELEVLWQKLIAIADEAAHTLIRTSFSSVVRDNYDFACSICDASGRLIAQQGSYGVPSFLGTMPRTLKAMLARFPLESLAPGDVLATNDPWFGTGHLNDITLAMPLFHRGRPVAFLTSVAHTADIGGAGSNRAREVYEEGIWLPVLKLAKGGREVEEVFAILAQNVRAPEETVGDVRAQMAALWVGGERIRELLEERGLEDLDALAEGIIARSEARMRELIRTTIPEGTYTDSIATDGLEVELRIQAAIRVAEGTIAVDYAGTSPQVPLPINAVLNYTYAYTAYPLKCLLDPATPNNEGCFRPISVTAPEGSLLNPRPPAAVWARMLTGHFLANVVFGALARAIPERVLADSASPVWSVNFRGSTSGGENYVYMYFMNGGHGARATKDGPSCLSFPSNLSNSSLEEMENSIPILAREKRLLLDSGGPGRFRGGCAQRVSFEGRSEEPLLMGIRYGRVKYAPRGFAGGRPGRKGRILLDGSPLEPAGLVPLRRGQVVTFELPGGGGMFPPEGREPALLGRDVESGLVSPEAAREDYGLPGASGAGRGGGRG